jgi:hypothetical protein
VRAHGRKGRPRGFGRRGRSTLADRHRSARQGLIHRRRRAHDRRGRRQDRLLRVGDLARLTRSHQDVRKDEIPAIELPRKHIIKRVEKSIGPYAKKLESFPFQGAATLLHSIISLIGPHRQFGGPLEYWPNAKRASI